MKTCVSIFILLCFLITSEIGNYSVYAQAMVLPAPGTMVDLSPAFEPVLMKGLKVHPENPFLFDFILDVGDGSKPSLREESARLIKYFLASLTIPEKDLWVNLSPYEKNRMIADNLGQTEMGRDMLAQDYILKQLTASLIYPEKHLGKIFWDEVYAKARQMYGTIQIPVNTFNKVWIVADKADVFERGNVAYVVGAHLKVMLEEDYLALSKHQSQPGDIFPAKRGMFLQAGSHSIASQIIKQIILPQIEQEVNQGQHFAPLRQMFYAMILASWYKMALKDAILSQIYGNKSKVKIGVNQADSKDNEKIFDRYLKAYKKGVFNYIKQDIDQATDQAAAKKYFSGGEAIWQVIHPQITTSISRAMLGAFNKTVIATVNMLPEQFQSSKLKTSAAMSVKNQDKERQRFDRRKTVDFIVRRFKSNKELRELPILSELSKGLKLDESTFSRHYETILIELRTRLKLRDYRNFPDLERRLTEALEAKQREREAPETGVSIKKTPSANAAVVEPLRVNPALSIPSWKPYGNEWIGSPYIFTWAIFSSTDSDSLELGIGFKKDFEDSFEYKHLLTLKREGRTIKDMLGPLTFPGSIAPIEGILQHMGIDDLANYVAGILGSRAMKAVERPEYIGQGSNGSQFEIYQHPEGVSQRMARELIEIIETNNSRGENSVIFLFTGVRGEATSRAFVDQVLGKGPNFLKLTKFFYLDEYWMGNKLNAEKWKADKRSYYSFSRNNLINLLNHDGHLRINPDQVFVLSGTGENVKKEADQWYGHLQDALDEKVRSGGKRAVDIFCGGSGSHGHIAFIEETIEITRKLLDEYQLPDNQRKIRDNNKFMLMADVKDSREAINIILNERLKLRHSPTYKYDLEHDLNEKIKGKEQVVDLVELDKLVATLQKQKVTIYIQGLNDQEKERLSREFSDKNVDIRSAESMYEENVGEEELSYSTVIDNYSDFIDKIGEMTGKAITVKYGIILDSQRVRIAAFGAKTVKPMGRVSRIPEASPVLPLAVLLKHHDAKFILDKEAAAEVDQNILVKQPSAAMTAFAPALDQNAAMGTQHNPIVMMRQDSEKVRVSAFEGSGLPWKIVYRTLLSIQETIQKNNEIIDFKDGLRDTSLAHYNQGFVVANAKIKNAPLVLHYLAMKYGFVRAYIEEKKKWVIFNQYGHNGMADLIVLFHSLDRNLDDEIGMAWENINRGKSESTEFTTNAYSAAMTVHDERMQDRDSITSGEMTFLKNGQYEFNGRTHFLSIQDIDRVLSCNGLYIVSNSKKRIQFLYVSKNELLLINPDDFRAFFRKSRAKWAGSTRWLLPRHKGSVADINTFMGVIGLPYVFSKHSWVRIIDPSIPSRFINIDIEEFAKFFANRAMATKATGIENVIQGGIDLSRSQINVSKEVLGVNMQFDRAMIERINRHGFDGLDFQIQSIMPVVDLALLLGLNQQEGF